jgi:hypothetical protein
MRVLWKPVRPTKCINKVIVPPIKSLVNFDGAVCAIVRTVVSYRYIAIIRCLPLREAVRVADAKLNPLADSNFACLRGYDELPWAP